MTEAGTLPARRALAAGDGADAADSSKSRLAIGDDHPLAYRSCFAGVSAA